MLKKVCAAFGALLGGAMGLFATLDPAPLIFPLLLALTFGILGFLIAERRTTARSVAAKLKEIGAADSSAGLESELANLLHEIERLLQAISLEGAHTKKASAEDVSRALERVSTRAFRLLKSESAELALFDRSAGAYRSSFVLGKPFRESSQAMLSGVMEDTVEVEMNSDVMVHPILFSGETLGSIRVGLRTGTKPSVADQRLLTLLAAQASLIIINSRYTEELLRMKRASEESIRAKTGFLANLSHEIRGPLGIMLNANELVMEELCGPVTADQRETLGMIQKNGKHLLELINDVLDYAKGEAGNIKAEPAPHNVNELLEDISNVVRAQAEAKHHSLIFKPAGDATLAVVCDRRHLRQMLINLLTNAIKYTPDNGKIEIWAETAARNTVKLLVKDSGVGISQEDREKVFSAFERIDHEYSRQQVGTGLGMPLTRKLAEANSGTVDFSSKVGEGSTFWIALPAAHRASEVPAINDQSSVQQPSRVTDGTRVLLVESQESERWMLSRYLAHAGFTVFPASGRSEAEASLKRDAIQLILIDDRTAGEDPVAFIERLRRSSPAQVPLVLTSGRAFAFETERFLKAGVDRCITKPIELGTLARTLADLVKS